MYSEKKKYADLIVDFPSSAQETYTYSLEGNHHVRVGQVVEIPFGKRSTLGIIKSVFALPPHNSIELKHPVHCAGNQIYQLVPQVVIGGPSDSGSNLPVIYSTAFSEENLGSRYK